MLLMKNKIGEAASFAASLIFGCFGVSLVILV
jgi:hypothetical protein